MIYKKSEKGFIALTELIVIIGIAGILLAMAIPQFTAARKRARVAEAISNMGNIISPGCELFKLDIGRYPNNIDELVDKNIITNPREQARWKGPYISNLPKLQDPWGVKYSVSIVGAGCFIHCYGPNRVRDETNPEIFSIKDASSPNSDDLGIYLR